MKTKKFLAFSCTHHPLHDPEAIEWLFKQIKDFKPEVLVNLGDGLEADAASRFPSEHSFTLEEEYDSHNAFLQRLVDATPNAKRVYMEGNHCLNIREEDRISKKVRSLCDYRKHQPALKEFKWYPYDYSKKGIFRLGQITFFHGFEAGQSSGRMQAVLLGKPHGLTVSGHTHRPEHVTRVELTKGVPLPYWYANTGTLRTMECNFMKRKRSHSWGQAVVVGEAQVTQSPREKRCWDAETRVFRMADDEIYGKVKLK